MPFWGPCRPASATGFRLPERCRELHALLTWRLLGVFVAHCIIGMVLKALKPMPMIVWRRLWRLSTVLPAPLVVILLPLLIAHHHLWMWWT
jgi:hypothetical protein